jgi:hypothetical protein
MPEKCLTNELCPQTFVLIVAFEAGALLLKPQLQSILL